MVIVWRRLVYNVNRFARGTAAAAGLVLLTYGSSMVDNEVSMATAFMRGHIPTPVFFAGWFVLVVVHVWINWKRGDGTANKGRAKHDRGRDSNAGVRWISWALFGLLCLHPLIYLQAAYGTPGVVVGPPLGRARARACVCVCVR